MLESRRIYKQLSYILTLTPRREMLEKSAPLNTRAFVPPFSEL